MFREIVFFAITANKSSLLEHQNPLFLSTRSGSCRGWHQTKYSIVFKCLNHWNIPTQQIFYNVFPKLSTSLYDQLFLVSFQSRIFFSLVFTLHEFFCLFLDYPPFTFLMVRPLPDSMQGRRKQFFYSLYSATRQGIHYMYINSCGDVKNHLELFDFKLK